MGFLDFFIERDDTKKDEAPKYTPQPSVNLPSTSQTQVSTPRVSTVSPDDLQKFNEHFDDLFEKANLPGPDYFEFQKMCQAMATLSDEMKFPAVFNGLQVQGLTKQKLLDTAGSYIKIIEEDSKKFEEAINQKLLSEVQRKKNEAEAKRKYIAEREEMIKKLREEIANETTQISLLEGEAGEQEQKAIQKATIYKTACEARKNSIMSDIEKIKTLIK